MRIAGVTIPKDKRVVIALTYIFGVGSTISKNVLKQAQVDQNTKVSQLSQEQEDKIRNLIEKAHKTEGDLRREVSSNIKRLKDLFSVI